MVGRTTARDQKKAADCRGIMVFEDEASFWLDGTSHQTWSPVGVQPRVPTYGLRKTAHVYGAVAVDTADFVYQFADVFNGHSFHQFLLTVVERHKIELHRLPPYSPEFNPTEGVWKTTRKMATHNRFYPTVLERDAALRQTFDQFRRTPELIDHQVARFRRAS